MKIEDAQCSPRTEYSVHMGLNLDLGYLRAEFAGIFIGILLFFMGYKKFLSRCHGFI